MIVEIMTRKGRRGREKNGSCRVVRALGPERDGRCYGADWLRDGEQSVRHGDVLVEQAPDRRWRVLLALARRRPAGLPAGCEGRGLIVPVRHAGEASAWRGFASARAEAQRLIALAAADYPRLRAEVVRLRHVARARLHDAAADDPREHESRRAELGRLDEALEAMPPPDEEARAELRAERARLEAQIDEIDAELATA